MRDEAVNPGQDHHSQINVQRPKPAKPLNAKGLNSASRRTKPAKPLNAEGLNN